jgi:hypothetical protein
METLLMRFSRGEDFAPTGSTVGKPLLIVTLLTPIVLKRLVRRLIGRLTPAQRALWVQIGELLLEQQDMPDAPSDASVVP